MRRVSPLAPQTIRQLFAQTELSSAGIGRFGAREGSLHFYPRRQSAVEVLGVPLDRAQIMLLSLENLRNAARGRSPQSPYGLSISANSYNR